MKKTAAVGTRLGVLIRHNKLRLNFDRSAFLNLYKIAHSERMWNNTASGFATSTTNARSPTSAKVRNGHRSTFEQCPLCLQQRTSEFGSDYIRHSSSGSFATLPAIRRASSLLSNFAAERQKNLEGQ
jgi:hypothetical protein